jgi:hypothetical protein
MLSYVGMRGFAITLVAVLGLFLTACRDENKQVPTGTFDMGERAQAGALIYTVYDSKWALNLGESVAPRIPANRFLILNVTAVNSGSKPINIPSFSLVDDSGQVYPELENGEGVSNWMGIVRRVRPADSIQGAILFDVPQKQFKLHVADEEDHFALVNIPLTLSDPPLDVNTGLPARPR